LAETILWCLTEKGAIAPYQSENVPVLLDGDIAVVDSWTIANYLEDTYPDRPSLFGGDGGCAVGCMLNWWGDVTVMAGLFPMIVVDIFSQMQPVDAAYFRKSRDARLGKRLEEVAAGRDKTVEGFRKLLEPLRKRRQRHERVLRSIPAHCPPLPCLHSERQSDLSCGRERMYEGLRLAGVPEG
jgi:glutathione S-transferase